MTRLSAAFVVFCALGATAAVAQAQPPGPTSGPQQPDLSSVLHLRPDQIVAYQAYKANSRPTPDEMSQMRAPRQPFASLSTPQRLDKIGMELRLRQEMFQRNADATRAFYGQLTPDQQHTFDQVTAPPSGRGRGPQG